MPRKKSSKKHYTNGGNRKNQEDSLNLEDIDKICREIDEEERRKRKRGYPEDESRSLPASVASGYSSNTNFNTVRIDSDMKCPTNSQWLEKTVRILIEHLNKFGACVIDDFLGHLKCLDILDEVNGLQSADVFTEGQLASMSPAPNTQFRNDKITWTDGIDPPCPSIKHLISVLDAIVTSANTRTNNGCLSNYDISGRTNAMVACYPGEGAHYVKHVDNPNSDGRCVTAIYYLNKNWNPQEDGGALKIYSTYVPGVVANIDPIFDRVIFFWSDRRNPHEVMPAYKERYAITVWYLDKKEKATYDENMRMK